MNTAAARTMAALAALCATGCGGQGRGDAPPRKPRPVRLVAVSTIELPRTISVTGVLAPQEELVLGMQVAGRLQTLTVDVGDAVEQSALLAAMDPRELFEALIER